MSHLTDLTIDALRAHHETLAALVPGLTDEQLAATSGASEWSVADALSHLGSQAEILRLPIVAAVEGTPVPTADNQAIWDRWNALSPRGKAEGYVDHEARYVATVEALSPGQRETLTIELGFLPEPAPVSLVLAMRLQEVALHAWDVRVGVDLDAEVDPVAADLLLEHLTGELGFLLGYTAKPSELAEPATLAVGGRSIEVGSDVVAVRPGTTGATAGFQGPSGAVMRLLSGRLTESRTPAGVEVTGNVTLDELRRVFPGY